MSMVEFTGQTYGEGARQRASQRMVPPGPSPTGEVDLGPLNRPTEAPNEPITAGLPMGAGPGPEAIPPVGVGAGSKLDLALQIRAIASRYPNPALLALLQELER
jgi:hypothetical protein